MVVAVKRVAAVRATLATAVVVMVVVAIVVEVMAVAVAQIHEYWCTSSAGKHYQHYHIHQHVCQIQLLEPN